MNIGIVTTWFERGAAYVSKQYMNILEKKHSVYIYARGGEKYAINDPNWDRKNVWWGKSSHRCSTDIDVLDFNKWLKENNIDVCFFNEQNYMEPVLLCRDQGIKVGAYIDYYKKDTTYTFEIYDFLICNTKRHYGVFKNHKQAFYVPWGTDINKFQQVNKGRVANENKITFFVSAGFSPIRKGVDKTLQAFYLLFQKYKNCKLVIHSQVDLRQIMPEQLDMIDELQMNNALEIINGTVTAPGLYYKGDVYVYASWLDGIGLTIAEALSSGLPIIVTDSAPMNEFGDEEIRKVVSVENYVSREDAYYWPLSIVSVESLKQAMEYYVLHAGEIIEIKDKARNYAERNLNWNDNEKAILDIFEKTKIIEVESELRNNVRIEDKKIRHIEYRLKEFMENIKKLNVLFDTLKKKEKVYIYGAGEHTEKLFEFTNIKELEIAALIDKNAKQKKREDYLVITPEEIQKGKNVVIIISSFEWQNSIEKDLRNKYFFEGDIVKLYENKDVGPFYLV